MAVHNAVGWGRGDLLHVPTKASVRVAVLKELTRKVTEIIAKSATLFNARMIQYRYLRMVFPLLEVMDFMVDSTN